jgi:hypothetical protein
MRKCRLDGWVQSQSRPRLRGFWTVRPIPEKYVFVFLSDRSSNFGQHPPAGDSRFIGKLICLALPKGGRFFNGKVLG